MNSLRSPLTALRRCKRPEASRVSQREKVCFQRSKDVKNDANSTSRQDVYSRITSQIVASLEQGGVRPWVKPWNAEHAAGRITQPLRFNGQPYSGINILSLWMSAAAQGCREGVRLAALQFLSQYREAIRNIGLDRPV
jgi:hypothetical protein